VKNTFFDNPEIIREAQVSVTGLPFFVGTEVGSSHLYDGVTLFSATVGGDVHKKRLSFKAAELMRTNAGPKFSRKCNGALCDQQRFFGSPFQTYTDTPTAGPSQRSSRYFSFQDQYDAARVPKLLSLIHELTNRAIPASLKSNRLLHRIAPIGLKKLMHHCRISILTMDFCNTHHLDANDKYAEPQQSRMFSKMFDAEEAYLDYEGDPNCEEEFHEKFDYLLNLMTLGEGFSTDTTCGYQFLEKDPSPGSVQFKQYFDLAGLGIFVKLCDNSTINFFGNIFSHCTAVPIAVIDGERAVVPSVDKGLCVFAWGASGAAEGSSKKRRSARLKAKKRKRK